MNKNQPMAEVFGFPIDNMSTSAVRARNSRLCPFGNVVPNCTKDKANNPLGVCSVFDGENVVCTCPIRFREDWQIAVDSAAFFFEPDVKWTSLTEVRLKDGRGISAGNIDVVLVAYDRAGKVIDFGSLEVQAVYISGNVRNPFEEYIADPRKNAELNWIGKKGYPGPDFLSSSRKRLAPQLMFKGEILHTWQKRMAVALDRHFFATLPPLQEVEQHKADVAWLIYDLEHDQTDNRFKMRLVKTVYTTFHESLDQISKPQVGKLETFIDHLQVKLDKKLSPPDAAPIDLESI